MFTKINTISTRKVSTVEEISREEKVLVYAEFINDETLNDGVVESALMDCIKDKGNGEITETVPQRGANAGIEVTRITYTDNHYFKITPALWNRIGLDNHYLEPVQAGDTIYMFKYAGTTKKDDALFGGAVHSSKHTGLSQLIDKDIKFTLEQADGILEEAKKYNENVLDIFRVVTL